MMSTVHTKPRRSRGRWSRVVGAVTAGVVVFGMIAPAGRATAAPSPITGPTTGGTSVSDKVSGLTFTTAVTGYFHTVAIGADGNTYAWGRNDYGQLGDGTTTDRSYPVQVKTPTNVKFTKLTAGAYFTVAQGTDGNTYTWGGNDRTGLGNATSEAKALTPLKLTPPSGVTYTDFAAGDYHVNAIGSDGNTYSWGDDDVAQLGNETVAQPSKDPVKVHLPAGVTVTKIAANRGTAIALATNGSVYSWGYNRAGNLGTNSTQGASGTPTRVATPAGVKFTQVAEGYTSSLALSDDGTVYGWGINYSGQIGDGTTTDSSVPLAAAAPAAGVHYTNIASASGFSVATASNGKTYAWGSKLGNGTTTGSTKPTEVTLPSGVSLTYVYGTFGHVVALGTDGETYAWGSNSNGQIGNGSKDDAKAPVDVTAVPVSQVLFGTDAGTDLSQAGNTWTVKSPAGCGVKDVTVNYSQFGVAHQNVTKDGFTQGAAPVITTQPQGSEVKKGGTWTVNAAATGDATPTVQWQQASAAEGPWTDIADATSASTTVTPTEAVWVRAVFSNCVGQATTNAAAVTLAAEPTPTPTPTPSATPTPEVTPAASASQAPTPTPVGAEVSTSGSATGPALGLGAAVLVAAAASAVAAGRISRRRVRS